MQYTAEASLPADLPGISLETGLMYCNRNRKLYRDLLINFLERKAGTAEEIKTMMQMGDLSTAGRTAHSMRSSAGIIGAKELSKASAALEKSIDEGGNSCDKFLKTFKLHLDMVINGLGRFYQKDIPQITSVDTGQIDLVAVKILLNEFSELLDCDIGLAMHKLMELDRHLGQSFVAAEFSLLERNLDEFNIAAAKESLNKLAIVLGIANEDLQ